MTPRENLLALFRGEAAEWVPCCVHISNANNLPDRLDASLLEPPLDFLEISRFVGGDLLVEVAAGGGFAGPDVTTESHRDGEETTTIMHTPAGTLRSRTRTASVPLPPPSDLEAGQAPTGPVTNTVTVEHPVKTPEDYRALRYLYETRRHAFQADRAHEALDRMGEDGVVLLGGGPGSAFYSLVHTYVGLEQLIYHLADCPEEVEATLAVLDDAHARWYEAACELPITLIRATDDLDSAFVSPGLFEQYAEPALRRFAGICHKRGKKLVLHMCGHVRAFLPALRRTGIDAHHCLSSPPVGNTPLSEAREAYGPGVVIMARNDPNVLLSGDVAAVRSMAEELLDGVRPGDPFLVIVPCGRAPLENIRELIRTTRAHRRA